MNELHTLMKAANVVWPATAKFATQDKNGLVRFFTERPYRSVRVPIWYRRSKTSEVSTTNPTLKVSSRWYTNIVTVEQWTKEQWIEWTEVDRRKGLLPVFKGTIVDVIFNDGVQILGGSAGTRKVDVEHVIGIDPATGKPSNRVAHYWGNSAAFRIVGYRIAPKPKVEPEWIEWTYADRVKGAMPVSKGTVVDVQYENGEETLGVTAGTSPGDNMHVSGLDKRGQRSNKSASYWGRGTSYPIVKYRAYPAPERMASKEEFATKLLSVVSAAVQDVGQHKPTPDAKPPYEPWNTPACKSVSEEEFSISATVQHIRNLELAANEKLEQSAKLFAEAETLTKERLDLLVQLNVHLAELNLVVDFKNK